MTAALIVVDLQNGIVALPTAHPAGEVVARAAGLAAEFRERGLPVVVVTVTGTPPGRVDRAPARGTPPPDWTDPVAELAVSPDDLRITKRCWSAFGDGTLDPLLRERTVTEVVLAGISTSVGVESTARAAFDLGYNVTLAADAMTDTDAAAHEWSTTRVFPRLGTVLPADTVRRGLLRSGRSG